MIFFCLNSPSTSPKKNPKS